MWWQYKQNTRGSSSHKDLIIAQQCVNCRGLRAGWTAKPTKYCRILSGGQREKNENQSNLKQITTVFWAAYVQFR